MTSRPGAKANWYFTRAYFTRTAMIAVRRGRGKLLGWAEVMIVMSGIAYCEIDRHPARAALVLDDRYQLTLAR
jgi:hypothetical protein